MPNISVSTVAAAPDCVECPEVQKLHLLDLLVPYSSRGSADSLAQRLTKNEDASFTPELGEMISQLHTPNLV